MANQDALKYFVIAVPDNEDQAKAYFRARKALLAVTEIEQLKAEVEQLKRERDAAISDLKSICDDTGDGCDLCKHLPCAKDGVGHCIGWQWRGIKEGAEDGCN